MSQRLRCITLDVTGTLLGFKGHIGDIYCQAARRVGYPCPDYGRVLQGFKKAYASTESQYPCFGYPDMPSKEWWRVCVRESFLQAGYVFPEEDFTRIFQRIYSAFGSRQAYEAYPDSLPFMEWAKAQDCRLGILSNGTERYGDSILPMFQMHDELDFMVFSRDIGVKKPDPRIFEAALLAAGGRTIKEPQVVCHIGDSIEKDFEPAVSLGMHAIVLNRYKDKDVEECRKRGLVVVDDLLEARRYLIDQGLMKDTPLVAGRQG